MMKEKNIREMARRMNLVSIDDMCRYSIPQLVVMIANKMNELMDEVGQFESDVQETLKTQNENIQYLLSEGLHLEVENIFDGWFKDGTFDTLINQSALKKVNDRIDETNAQLSQTALNNRKINFILASTPWQLSYVGGSEHPNSHEEIDTQLINHKKLGFDGIVVLVTLVKDSTGKLVPDATMENILYYINKAKELGLSVRCVKFHTNNSQFNENGFVSQYVNKVLEITEILKPFNIPYACLYNEAVNYLYTNDTSVINSVTSLCHQVRAKGYKVGISGLSFDVLVNEHNWLCDCQDVMMPFDYRRIGYKGKRTTYEDAKSPYDELIKEFTYYKNKINKPFIISETGILPHWMAFANPVYFDWGDDVDNSGEIQKIFFYWLFENPAFNNLLEEVWVWFPDNMTDGDALSNCSKFISHYTKGGLINE